jgi:signal recognition particle receptor subunit beta
MIIFVVNATDRQHLTLSKEILYDFVLAPDPDMSVADLRRKHVHPLLVLANKQDLPNTMTNAEIIAALDLSSLRRPWHIVVRFCFLSLIVPCRFG